MDLFTADSDRGLDVPQKIALGLISSMVMLTFLATNVQALFWQSSDWLVGTVLPAVVIDLTNDERAEIAAAPLQRSSLLDAAAKKKAQHMAQNQYFAHFAPDGTSPWSFFKEVDYTYAHAGENLAIHFTDSSEVVDAWMDSPTHKANIVSTKYTEIGVGTAKGTYEGYDTVFVVQLFGAPAIKSPAVDSKTEAVETVTEPENQAVAPSASTGAAAEAVSQIKKELAEAQEKVDALIVDNDPTATVVETEATLSANSQVATDTTLVLAAKSTENSTFKDDVLVIETEISTSSGLAVASIVEPISNQKASIASVLTRPNMIMDVLYSFVIGAVVVLLLISFLGEVRRFHYIQVFYSLALFAGVYGLWTVHTLLTSGAVIL